MSRKKNTTREFVVSSASLSSVY